jgi:hypothetical protein
LIASAGVPKALLERVLTSTQYKIVFLVATMSISPYLVRKLRSIIVYWWCAFSELKEEKDILFSRHPIFLYNRLSFISEKEDKQAKKEWKILSAKGTAPDYLSEKVIEYSKKNTDNAYLPEALHRAIKTTRFGCTGEKTSEYSKSAFRILHKKFPNSEWTKKTPIHF